MFKFLKRKLKKFENKLETELEAELKKEIEIVEPENEVLLLSPASPLTV